MRTIILIPAILIALTSCRSIKAPNYPEPTTRDEAWLQDLDYLQTKFPEYNMSFTDNSLSEFTRIIEESKSNISVLSDNQIYVSIMKALSQIEDVHTSVNMRPSALKLKRLPIRFAWFEEGLYVVKSTPEHRDLLGAKVLLISGYTADELLRNLDPIIPGSDTYLRYESQYYLSSPDILEGLGLIEPDSELVIQLENSSGTIINEVFSRTEMGEKVYGYESWRELSPLSTINMDSKEMVHLLNHSDIPSYLASPDRSYYLRYDKERQTLYIQLNQNYDINSDIRAFTREVEDSFGQYDVQSVVVDLRFNTGGNLLNTGKLVKRIPQWHTGSGDIYIIVGGPTFSAGLVTAARLKYYAGEKAVVVGEKASEGLRFWAETRYFTLPNSELLLFAAYRYHNWENGKYDDGKKYFWLMRFIGVPVGDMDIDLPVSSRFKDYIEKRDTVLENIHKRIEKLSTVQ